MNCESTAVDTSAPHNVADTGMDFASFLGSKLTSESTKNAAEDKLIIVYSFF